MLETVSLIVSVASGLLAVVQSTKDIGGIKRNKVSFFLEEIALTLDEVVTKFKQNEVPHGACEKMKQYALNLPSVLDGMMEVDKLIDYSNRLYYAHELELLYKDVMQDKQKLVELETAAGFFHSAATMAKL